MPVVDSRSRIDDATKRTGVAWVEVDGQTHLVWQMWHDGRMYAVAGGAEQVLPPCEHAIVTVRTPDGPLSWPADVDVVEPGTPLWQAVTPALANRRLNAPDGIDAPARWAQESTVYVLTPAGPAPSA
jgi:hypothetical protein